MTIDASKILPGDSDRSIARAAEVLRSGGLVGMPTETVYGLAANALDTSAVAKVFAAKERPSFDPLIVHVPDAAAAAELAEFDATARRLAEAFWPGPMTLVLNRKRDAQGTPIVPDLVTAGLDSVGVRVPCHPVALKLLDQARVPLAAPSANKFGSISPTTAKHVLSELGGEVDLVIDGGPCMRGVESTVVRVREGQVEVLRLGALALEEIHALVGGAVNVLPPSSSPGNHAKPAPGMVDRHYAPGTPMQMVNAIADLPAIDPSHRVGLIGAGDLPADRLGFAVIRNLSEACDLAQAASRLFATLRELDEMKLDGIIAIAVPDVGLGRAINDRLRRGSTR